jgi:hypothetical protein
MEAKISRRKAKFDISDWKDAFLESLYLMVYKPMCSTAEFVVSRMAMTIIHLMCLVVLLDNHAAISNIVVDAQGIMVGWWGAQFVIRWELIAAMQVGVVGSLTVYLMGWVVSVIQLCCRSQNRHYKIRDRCESTFNRRVTFYLMALGGPILILFFIANEALLANAETQNNLLILSILQNIVRVYIFVFGLFALILNFASLCDKPCLDSFAVRSGTMLLFFENLHLLCSVSFSFFQIHHIDLQKVATVSHFFFFILRFKELLKIPFVNPAFNLWSLVFLSIESISSLIFVISADADTLAFGVFKVGISSMIVVVLVSLRLGHFLNIKIQISSLLSQNPNRHLEQTHVLTIFSESLMFYLDNINRQTVFGQILVEEPYLFHLISVVVGHRKSCSLVTCFCRNLELPAPNASASASHSKSHAGAEFDRETLRQFMRSLINGMYAADVQDTFRSCGSYALIHWLVHVEQNFCLAMTLISQLFTRKISVLMSLRLSFIKNEIKLYERSKSLHTLNYFEQQEKLARILDSEKQFKQITKSR